jgi:hypothetical protein
MFDMILLYSRTTLIQNFKVEQLCLRDFRVFG